VNPSFDASAIVRGSLVLLGLLAALFFGILVGESNWTVLSAIAGVILIATVAQFTLRHLVAFCLALAAIDFWAAPAGFKIGPMEQVGILAGACWLLVCWRKNFNPTAPTGFMSLKSWRWFQTIVFVSAAYAVAHFAYNAIDPYDELAFGWKGATKSYAQTFGAFLIIVLVVRSRLLVPLSSKDSEQLLRLFFSMLIISVSIGIARALTLGPIQETGLTLEEQSQVQRFFTIPVVNAYSDVYTLRQLGPAAVLVGSTFLFSRPANMSRFLPFAVMVTGFVGSAFSGGRASIVIAGAFLLLALCQAKKAGMAFAFSGLAAIFLSFIVLVPVAWLKETPWHVQRSLAWLRPDLSTQATEGVEGSTNMRVDLFKYAWQRYTSGDPRLIVFGRSVGQMEYADVMTFQLYDDLGRKEFAVRRLATHNGMTDFLLGWGLIGYLLNVGMCVGSIILLFSYNKHFKPATPGSCWTFIALVFMAFWLLYTHFGGAFVWPLAIVFVLIALAQTSELKPNGSPHPHFATRYSDSTGATTA
jgi:hypothetical protein